MKKIYEDFQGYYLQSHIRNKLAELAIQQADRFEENGRLLVLSVEKLIEARSALAHSLIFRRLEVSRNCIHITTQ